MVSTATVFLEPCCVIALQSQLAGGIYCAVVNWDCTVVGMNSSVFVQGVLSVMKPPGPAN